MFLFFAITLSISHVSSQTCGYGYFTTSNDSCVFNCEYSSLIPITDLTFTDITNECDSMRIANTLYPDDCNSLNDLLWRNDSCECPYCPCTIEQNEASTIGITSYEGGLFDGLGPRKECVSCTCSSLPSSYGIDSLVYECESEMIVDNQLIWDDYQCPPEEACYKTSSGGNQYGRDVGDYWWDDVSDSNTLCETFCYCSGTDGQICETGFDDIMSNEKLLYAFMGSCGGVYNSGAPAVKYFLLFFLFKYVHHKIQSYFCVYHVTYKIVL